MNFKKISVAVVARALITGVAVSAVAAVSMTAPAVAQAPDPAVTLKNSIVAAVRAALTEARRGGATLDPAIQAAREDAAVRAALEGAIVASGANADVVARAIVSARGVLNPTLTASQQSIFAVTLAIAETAVNNKVTGSVRAGGGATGGIAFAQSTSTGGGGSGAGTEAKP